MIDPKKLPCPDVLPACVQRASSTARSVLLERPRHAVYYLQALPVFSSAGMDAEKL
jgi:hypothetical protein